MMMMFVVLSRQNGEAKFDVFYPKIISLKRMTQVNPRSIAS